MAAAQGGARQPRLRDRRQSVFQPPGATCRRITGDPGRIAAPRGVHLRPRGHRLGASLTEFPAGALVAERVDEDEIRFLFPISTEKVFISRSPSPLTYFSDGFNGSK